MSDKLPLKQHLGTNYVPSAEDLTAIKNFLEASDKEMYDIDVEMDQLQQRLKLLQEKRSKVNDVVEQYNALTSPARRLGPDILEEIFLACLPTNYNPCIIATEAPVLLTHICSSWRSIAHSTPRLWSSIHIVLPNLRLARDPPAHTIPFMECLGHKKLTQRYEAAIDWLNRSGACPLNISVYQSAGYNIGVNFPGVDRYAHISEKEKQLHIAFIIDVLVSHSQRWHEIDVCLSWQVLEAILAVRNIPVLKKLHITDQRLASISELDSSGPGWNSLIELLKVSRGLTSLSFCGFVVRSTDMAQMPQVVSEQLTELTLDAYPGMSTLLSASHYIPVATDGFTSSVIRNCRSLRSLKLVLVTGGMADLGGQGPITFPNLTSLSISASVSSETLHFVESLRLPSLTQLDLQFHVGYYDSHSDLANRIFEAFLRESGDTLQSFGLNSTSPLTTLGLDLIQFLPLIPRIKSLKFYSHHLLSNRWRPFIINATECGATVNDEFISVLSSVGKDYADTLCPQLEDLDCDPGVITNVSAYTLREFVTARRNAHLRDERISPIKRLRIFINEFRHMDPIVEKVSLEDSAVYFRQLGTKFSPWEGLETCREEQEREARTNLYIPFEVSPDF